MLLTLPDFLEAIAGLYESRGGGLSHDETWIVSLPDGTRRAVTLFPLWHGASLLSLTARLEGLTGGALLQRLEDRFGPPTRRFHYPADLADDGSSAEVHWDRTGSPIFVSAQVRPAADEEVLGLVYTVGHATD